MLTVSYICISLSVFSLLLVIRIIRKKERNKNPSLSWYNRKEKEMGI